MAKTRTSLFDLVADDIQVRRHRDQLDTIELGDISLDVAPRYMHTNGRAYRIAALERLSEVALEVAAELHTGRRDDLPTTPITNA
ncbi:hypothetical protein DFP74_5766 [Nocardiopsis sp. Huas11]|uniref:hypothetical protein n=1 Tax=Nocardiopsis sp. Huas11 TaxID=2183912 RepID=UPI000EB4B5BC|nr:hypothetical protein [Nocardiopsis sp. Huas11]RKS10020.1 hypothetical protein DFP74_5766 [Nocardiopsis sp. Huas11]